MKNKNGYLALGVLFAVFSVVAFVAPIEKAATFWAAYGFAVAAMAFQIPAGKKALGSTELKSIFLGWPLLYVSAAYLAAQLLVSLACMLIPHVPVWLAVILSAVLLALACFGVLGAGAARERITKTEAKVQSKVSYLKTLQSDVEVLAAQETDAETKKALQALAQDIRYSDPMSSDALADLEAQIQTAVQALATAPDKKAKIAEIQTLVKQRSIKCKALKG